MNLSVYKMFLFGSQESYGPVPQTRLSVCAGALHLDGFLSEDSLARYLGELPCAKGSMWYEVEVLRDLKFEKDCSDRIQSRTTAAVSGSNVPAAIHVCFAAAKHIM